MNEEKKYYDNYFNNESNKPKRFIEINKLVAKPLPEPSSNGKNEIFKFLTLLFEKDEFIGFNARGKKEKNENDYVPLGRGITHFTKEGFLNNIRGPYLSIESQLEFNSESKFSGVWIRVNPLDGKGVANENVVDHRHAILEFNTVSVEKQIAVFEALKLPIKCFVHTGAKSVHAVVKIDSGGNRELYDYRVKFLIRILKENQIEINLKNIKPNMYSRLPGVFRGENKQYLIDPSSSEIENYDQWLKWIQWEQQDPFPKFRSYFCSYHNPLPLKQPLIDDILRCSSKMLIAGPSKSGKSFLAINLFIALLEGKKWLNWQCRKSNVLFINLELEDSSFDKRVNMVQKKLNLPPQHKIDNIWNLRGYSPSFEQLSNALLRRLQSDQFDAIIIDPIYQLLDGDENSAQDVVKFTNLVDKICNETEASLIYISHFKKSVTKKIGTGMDSISGSGVLVRHSDALIMLNPTEQRDKYILDMNLRDFPEPDPIKLKFNKGIHQIIP